MRTDLTETVRGEQSQVPFSAVMARRYAWIYLFVFHFSEKGSEAWINSVLRVMGWKDGDGTDVRRIYLMRLTRVLRDLRRDFDFEVKAVRRRSPEPGRDGHRCFETVSYGVFAREELRRMLLSNRTVFENIIESGMGGS